MKKICLVLLLCFLWVMPVSAFQLVGSGSIAGEVTCTYPAVDSVGAGGATSYSIGEHSGMLWASTSYTPSVTFTLRRVTLAIYKAGSPTFNITARVLADNGDAPNEGSVLATSTTTYAAADLETTATATTFDFAGYELTGSTKYHIQILGDGYNDASNRVRMLGTTGDAASGHDVNRDNYAGVTNYADEQLTMSTHKCVE